MRKNGRGHRKFNIGHLTKFLKENKKQTSRVNLFPIENEIDFQISYQVLKGDLHVLQETVMNLALASDRGRVLQFLNGLYLADFPLHRIYDQLLTPIFHKIGTLWQQGKISILDEHFATQTIRDSLIRLQGIIRLPEKMIGTAFCLNLTDELHDTALKMIDHLLELRGFNVLYSGQMTPFFDVKNLFESFEKPKRVYISSSFVIDLSASQQEFDNICAKCVKHEVKVFIGGAGFDQLKVNYSEVVMRLYNFKDVFTI